MPGRFRVHHIGVAIALVAGPCRGDILFEAETTLTIREPAAAIVAADLDGDGRVDVALVSAFGAVSALLNRDGELAPVGEVHELGGTPLHITSGDLDGDGDEDLVVTDPGSDSVFVLPGDGDGTFAAPRPLMVGFAPRQSAIGEFNGDRLPDLVAVNTSARSASVLFGRGGGEFESAREVEVGPSPHSVVTGDFNEDGFGDIAVAIGDEARVQLLTGSAAGDFGASSVGAGEVPRWLASGDFDGDGHLDIAVGNQNSQNIQVLLGDGGGAFPRELVRTLDDPIDFVTTARIDADEDLDLVITVVDSDTGDSRIEVLPGLGDGRFDTASFTFTLTGTLAVDTGDLDGDGAEDLVVGTTDTNRLTIVSGRGDGSFVSSTILPVEGRPTSVAVGDVTGDGLADIVAATDGALTLFAGDAERRFELRPVEAPGAVFSGVAVGDLDGEAPLDIAAVDFAAGELHIYLGGGELPRLDARYPVGILPSQVVLGAFDGDDLLDAAVLNTGSNDLSVARGLGGGKLERPRAVAIGVRATRLAAGDLDGDPHADIVVAGEDASEVLFGDEAGSFERRVALVDAAGVAPAIGHLDADGLPDVAIAYDDGVRLVRGLGGGSFAGAVPLALGGFPAAVALADLDLRGPDEIVVGASGANRVEVLARQADASYSIVASLGAGDPRAVVVADVDDDGALDVLTVDRVTETLTLIFGRVPAAARYQRGDANVDGALNLADAVFVLNALFGGGDQPPCEKAADTNDDGAVNIGDPVFLLNRLFGGGAPLKEPAGGCGVDPTPDALSCVRFDRCR